MKDERGAAAMEFAIVAPVMILLVLGVIVAGWSMHGVAAVHNALELAGRALQMSPTLSASELGALVDERIAHLNDPSVSVTLAIEDPSGGYKLAHITANYTFSVNIPLVDAYSVAYQTSVTVPLLAS